MIRVLLWFSCRSSKLAKQHKAKAMKIMIILCTLHRLTCFTISEYLKKKMGKEKPLSMKKNSFSIDFKSPEKMYFLSLCEAHILVLLLEKLLKGLFYQQSFKKQCHVLILQLYLVQKLVLCQVHSLYR